MASLQRVASCVSTVTSSSYVQSRVGDTTVNEHFPAGLRVLVVDDDLTTLKVLEKKLHRLLYHVTTCLQATLALKTLRENKGSFDVVLSDVHMPDMDGYKLLEHVGLEMDLPVIMMSADSRISAVMKGIRHGACDYLIKPVRDEELKNIWQHVVRKKWNENKEFEQSGSMDDSDRQKRGNDDTDYACSVNEGTEVVLKGQRKRSNTKDEDDTGPEDDDPSTSKKPRVVWSVELHQQFVSAVNQLGIDKAVPKRILELMNVPGLTRENVASHLQKFRLYLKRLSGVAQQGGLHPTFCVPLDSDGKLNILGRYDAQSLAASGHIPPQTLAALQAELFGRSTGSPITTIDQPALLQASLQGPKGIPVEPSITFGQALAKFQSNISTQFPSTVVSVGEIPSGFGVWPRNTPGSAGASSNMGAMGPQNANMLPQPQKQQLPSLKEPSHSINVQPSCLVVPSHTPFSFPPGNSPPPVGQNCNFNSGSVNNYSPLLPQSNSSSLPIVQIQGNDLKATSVISEYSVPRPITSPMSSCSATADNTTTQRIHNSAMTFRVATQLPELPPSIGSMEGSYDNLFEVIDQGRFGNLGFVGKGTCIPSRFAVDEPELPLKNLCQGKLDSVNNYNKVKQEPHTEFVDTLTTIGGSIKQQFNSNDLMSVLSD